MARPTPTPPRKREGSHARKVRARLGSQRPGRIFASPLARRLAKEPGVDLAALAGSGPHGRIVKRDVEAALQTTARARPQRPAPPSQAAPQPAACRRSQPMPDDKILALYEKGSYEVVPHDGMRKHHRPAPHAVEADHPAFLSDGRLPHRRPARRAQRINAHGAQGRSARLQALGQRLRHQGAGAGAAAGAAPPTRPGPKAARCATACRHRRGRGLRGRAVHARHSPRRAEIACRKFPTR